MCNHEKLSVVHAYLKRHFSDRAVRNLHAPTSTNLMRAGVLGDSGDYHVVSIAADPPSHAVLLKDFLEQPLADVEESLRHWDLAHVLHAHRIVIVGSTHVSALQPPTALVRAAARLSHFQHNVSPPDLHTSHAMDSEIKELQPSKALVAAVLLRACDDLKLGRRLAARAQQWFTVHAPTSAWSFEWCCAILDLDPAAVRKQCLVLRAGADRPGNPRRELENGG